MIAKIDMDTFVSNFSKNCNKVKKKSYSKNQTITTYIKNRNHAYILTKGSADLVRYDFNGYRTIIEHFSKNDIFGDIFYIVTTNNELSVEAREDCDALLFSYDDIQNKCKTNCRFHEYLSDNITQLILNKVVNLNMRVELLTKRSIRDKLLGYFTLISTQKLSSSFELPFSLTNLADYLSVDRSAMMRELKLLKEDGFISKVGNRIILNYK